MDASLTLNLTALAVSLLALVISVLLSVRQLQSMRHANHLPVAIELLTRDFNSDTFLARERKVVAELAEHNPALGFSGLPDEIRTATYSVAFFYDSIAILVAFRFIQENLVLGTMSYRIRRIWRVLEAHIDGERRLRGHPFLDVLEHLAALAFAQEAAGPRGRIRLRTVSRSREPMDQPGVLPQPVSAS